MGKGKECSCSLFGCLLIKTSNNEHQQSAGSTQPPASSTEGDIRKINRSYPQGKTTRNPGNTTRAPHKETHGNPSVTKPLSVDRQATTSDPKSLDQPGDAQENSSTNPGLLNQVFPTLKKGVDTLRNAAGTWGSAAGAYLVPPKPGSTGAAELKQQEERATVNILQGELQTERAAVKSLQGELQTERAAVKSLQGELQTERAEVLQLKGLNKKETGAGQALKAELETLKDDRHRLSRELTEVRDVVRTLKAEKEAANRTKIMVEVYRQTIEDQACRSLGKKNYDSWELEMVVNRANKQSTGTTRYGAVYKSKLDQKDVVVEILTNKGQQSQQDFNQKVDILTRLRHPNLVSYIGASKEYALICEDFPKDTLQDRLVDKSHKSPFSWDQRVSISANICSTLLFLHNTKPSPIIHGDLEAKNICFDADYICRLSVFGMSRSMQHTTNNNTAPSIQSDMRAFGIILLQIVTGQAEKNLVRKKVVDIVDANQFQEKNIEWQREELTNKNIVDDRLDDRPTEDVVKMLLLGLRCSHPKESQRPDLATEVWPQIQSMKRRTSGGRG